VREARKNTLVCSISGILSSLRICESASMFLQMAEISAVRGVITELAAKRERGKVSHKVNNKRAVSSPSYLLPALSPRHEAEID